jgi:HYDIN/CFA65/VesB family protein
MTRFFSVFFICIFLGALPFSAKNAWAVSGVTADVASLDFGDQAEGTIGDPKTVTLTNSLGGDGVIGAITVAGQDPLQFLISEDLCSGIVLGNGASCSLSMVYRPSAAFSDGVGPAQALLLVPFNDPPALSIALSGNSLVPEIQSDVSSMDFGEQTENRLSDPRTVTLTNIGQADLVLQNTKIIGADSVDFGLSLDLCSFQSLAPGKSCQIEIGMRPTDVGNRTAQLAIETNDPDKPIFLIDLTGNGKGSGGCSMTSFDNGLQGRGKGELFLMCPWLFALGFYRIRMLAYNFIRVQIPFKLPAEGKGAQGGLRFDREEL